MTSKTSRRATHRAALAVLKEGESHFIPAADGVARFGWFECPATREVRETEPEKGVRHYWVGPPATGESMDDLHAAVMGAKMRAAENDEFIIETAAQRALALMGLKSRPTDEGTTTSRPSETVLEENFNNEVSPDLPATDEPDDNPSSEDDKTGDADHGEKLEDDTASSVSAGHEVPSQTDAADYHEATSEPIEESAEPMPDELADTLARLVPRDASLDAKKAAAAKRWIELNAIRMDMAKPQSARAFNDLTPAESAELALLETWSVWFG